MKAVKQTSILIVQKDKLILYVQCRHKKDDTYELSLTERMVTPIDFTKIDQTVFRGLSLDNLIAIRNKLSLTLQKADAD